MKTQVPGYIYDLCRKLRRKSTDAEKFLWECLRSKRLKGLKFRRQHPLGRYMADFYCLEARLVVELDGKIHYVKDQTDYDKAGQEVKEMRGIRVLKVKNREVEKNIERVGEKTVSLTPPP